MPQWWLHSPHTLLTALTILLVTHEICINLLQSSLLCIRGNPHALDEELERKFLIQLKDEQILYKWWFTHISLPSFVWSMYMCMLMSWESTCAEKMCCANSIENLWADSWHYSSSEALSKTTFPVQGSIL